MDNKNGFFVDESNTKIKNKIQDEEFIFNSEINCIFCNSSFLDLEIKKVFNISCCGQCRYNKLKFVTKTTATKHYLLTESDLKNLKFISRPNPHKGNWHDMCLYLEDEIKKISMNKYQNEENLEEIKNNRIEIIKNRKIKKLKTKIRDLKRKTIITRPEIKKHTHFFIGSSKIKKCKECGMEIERESI